MLRIYLPSSTDLKLWAQAPLAQASLAQAPLVQAPLAQAILVKVRAAQNSCTSKQFSLTKIHVEQNKVSWYLSQIYIYEHVSK